MDADKPPHSRDSGDCAAEGRGGTAAERRTGQRHGGGCLKGGRAERRGRAEPEDEKKARWNLAAVERKGMRSKPPRYPQDDGRLRGAEGRWVRRQETEMDLTETHMKRLASCAPHVGKNGGAGVPRWRGETRRGRLRAEMHRLLRGNRGRPAEGAASIETTRHYKLNRAPRYYRPRASACRRAPPTEWTSRSAAEGCRNDRASAPSRYGKRGRERSGRRCGEATT